jgi:hypothetical protein
MGDAPSLEQVHSDVFGRVVRWPRASRATTARDESAIHSPLNSTRTRFELGSKRI